MSYSIRKIIAHATALLLSLGVVGSVCAQSGAEDEIIPPKAVYKPDPSHPEYLYERGVEGEAIIVVSIDRLGTVLNPTVEKATDEEFGLAAMLAASEWIFEPASQGGVPINVKVRIPFEFNISFEHKLNVELGREIFRELSFPVTPSFELSNTPQPSFLPALSEFYPEEFLHTGQSAAISVEFIIDPKGFVINPRVISSSMDGFDESAIRAVSHMHYKTIRVQGQPVHVSMMMPLQFSE